MALVHDIVEIDAGDTFAYGAREAGKSERESQAAARLFGLLPKDQGDRLGGLWREMEEGKTPEARFVRVLDRLQPVLLHRLTGGKVWKEHGVGRSQVLARVDEIRASAPALWPTVCGIIDEAVRGGQLTDD